MRRDKPTGEAFLDLRDRLAVVGKDLGIAGEGPGTLAEYSKPGGHVDTQMIDDIAGWIRAH